jgi:hypothetical protein
MVCPCWADLRFAQLSNRADPTGTKPENQQNLSNLGASLKNTIDTIQSNHLQYFIQSLISCSCDAPRIAPLETTMQTRDDEIKMFGMTKQDIQDQYINSLTARLSGLEIVVAGILSDCQELQTFGRDTKEQIRTQLNVAKYILFEMQDRREALTED